MTIWTRWIQRGVLCGLMLGGFVGTAMSAGPPPPAGQIAANDHAALAAWYDKEGAKLRQQAKDERAMAEVFRKNPGYRSGPMAGSSTKIDMPQHCETLAGFYTKAAEEADQMAQGHRDMLK